MNVLCDSLFAVGNSLFAVGNSRYAVGNSRYAVGCSRYAVRCSLVNTETRKHVNTQNPVSILNVSSLPKCLRGKKAVCCLLFVVRRERKHVNTYIRYLRSLRAPLSVGLVEMTKGK